MTAYHRVDVPLGAAPHPAQRHLDRGVVLGTIQKTLLWETLTWRYSWQAPHAQAALHEHTLDTLLSQRIETSTLLDADAVARDHQRTPLLPTH